MLLFSELKQLAEARELISIERDCHDEELTGFIGTLTENMVSMQLFNNDGEFDGFTFFQFSQITQVFWGNREHQAILHLTKQKSAPEMPILVSSDLSDAILELNQRYSSLCFHEAHDEDRFNVAVIEEHDEDWYKIQTFSIRKSLSRLNKIINANTISRVVVDSPYQNRIVELHTLGL